jgi:hypothetical protein
MFHNQSRLRKKWSISRFFNHQYTNTEVITFNPSIWNSHGLYTWDHDKKISSAYSLTLMWSNTSEKTRNRNLRMSTFHFKHIRKCGKAWKVMYLILIQNIIIRYSLLNILSFSANADYSIISTYTPNLKYKSRIRKL